MQSLLSSMRSKPATWLLHIALATIVVGACVTHFFGEQGEVHVRADQATSLTTNHSTLTLFLWDFQIVSDEAGNPVDFISELRIMDRGGKKSEIRNQQSEISVDEGVVRMNKPLRYHGYRFCQSDYDSDGQGVVLSYNYDPWGIGITYFGYAMLAISAVLMLLGKRGRFRQHPRWQLCQ